MHRSMLPNRHRVRWLSASSQSLRACFTNWPPVFTNRCYKLVKNHFSIPFGSTKRRHKFPRLYAVVLSHSRT